MVIKMEWIEYELKFIEVAQKIIKIKNIVING